MCVCMMYDVHLFVCVRIYMCMCMYMYMYMYCLILTLSKIAIKGSPDIFGTRPPAEPADPKRQAAGFPCLFQEFGASGLGLRVRIEGLGFRVLGDYPQLRRFLLSMRRSKCCSSNSSTVRTPI